MSESTEYIVIEKFSEYVEFVEQLPKDFLLSRGQGGSYSLLPSGLRLDKGGNRKYQKSALLYFLNEFMIDSHSYLEDPTEIHNRFEYMVMAQHYGLPTRILDFTYSHIISLMFAVQNAFDEKGDSDGEVWFLNPNKLNLKFAKHNAVLDCDSQEANRIDDVDGPLAVKARKLNNRINSQDGMFVYFQSESKPLEELVDDSVLTKVIIKSDGKKSILSTLINMGIGFKSLYPELESVSKDILLKKYVDEYNREEE